jgi:hypothetical protein
MLQWLAMIFGLGCKGQGGAQAKEHFMRDSNWSQMWQSYFSQVPGERSKQVEIIG